MLEAKCGLAVERYNMLSQGDSVIVGLSGGADSSALLHYLCSLRERMSLNITAVHVNHMIRGEEAERDAESAGRLCERMGVEFHLYRQDVPSIAAQKGIGLEECGREVRYGIFGREAAQSANNAAGHIPKIATAHTLSDSVETVIFHIIRGCSINGLKGIPPVRGNIIRPLIYCERSDIEDYCARHDIDYVTDSTNLTADYARNKIRLCILPLMRELNPSVDDAIGRLSELAGADDELIGEYADAAADEYIRTGRADRLFESRMPVAGRALRKICVAVLNITPEQKHIAAMCDSLVTGAGSVNLPGDTIFRVRNGKISFSKKAEHSSTDSAEKNWSIKFEPGEIITPGGQKIISIIMDKNNYNNFAVHSEKNDKTVFKNCLDYDKIKGAVLRFRKEGDRFSPAGRNCSKSLKKLFNERKLPPEVRDSVPLMESEGKIAWISGIGAAEQFKVTDETERVLFMKTLSN